MSDQKPLIAFGPVPSRRLGRSLGVNNIPPKICSYSCIYCQIGRTLHYGQKREKYYDKDIIIEEVRRCVQQIENQGKDIDYITFVPDGEPTLDLNLGEEIALLKQFGKKIAVITNASLINLDDVREELYEADLVSLKIDSVTKQIWRNINRAGRNIVLESILEGIGKFSEAYTGKLITETMFVKGVNDGLEEITKVAGFIAKLKRHKSYISIPTRPPAFKSVEAADEHALTMAYFIFNKMAIETEYLIGYEGNEFAFTGDFERDILSITSVHPMRKDAVDNYLQKAHTDWYAVEKLVREQKLIEVPYNRQLYYMRKLS